MNGQGLPYASHKQTACPVAHPELSVQFFNQTAHERILKSGNIPQMHHARILSKHFSHRLTYEPEPERHAEHFHWAWSNRRRFYFVCRPGRGQIKVTFLC